MLLICAGLYFAVTVLKEGTLGCYASMLRCCGYEKTSEDVQRDFGAEVVIGGIVRQNIGTFWESMEGDEQKKWYASEVYS